MEAQVFKPPRSQGLAFQILIITLLAAASGFGLWRAFQVDFGPTFLLYLFLSLLAAALAPILAYRAYALYKASYTIERDGIHLSWGLRLETIPMDTLLWVYPAETAGQLAYQTEPGGPGALSQNGAGSSLPLPPLRWPGSVLGTCKLQKGGQVEYMAANSKDLILIATAGQLYAISPADRAAFLDAFQRQAELGSLSPLPPQSIYPSFLLLRIWNERPARYLVLAGLALCLALLVWVSLVVSVSSQVSLGFNPDGSLREPVPAVQLLLLPILSIFFFLADLLLGMFFYRRGDQQNPTIQLRDGRLLPFGQVLAYLVWGSGLLTSLFFLIGLFFVLQMQ